MPKCLHCTQHAGCNCNPDGAQPGKFIWILKVDALVSQNQSKLKSPTYPANKKNFFRKYFSPIIGVGVYKKQLCVLNPLPINQGLSKNRFCVATRSLKITCKLGNKEMQSLPDRFHKIFFCKNCLIEDIGPPAQDPKIFYNYL